MEEASGFGGGGAATGPPFGVGGRSLRVKMRELPPSWTSSPSFSCVYAAFASRVPFTRTPLAELRSMMNTAPLLWCTTAQ